MPSYLPPNYFSTLRHGASFGGAPGGFSSNFAQTIQPGYHTPDLESLWATTRRSNLARELAVRAQKQQADQDNALLNLALQRGAPVNLYSQPTNEDEARLQHIVQNDVNARERGVALIPSWETKQKYDRGWLQNDAIRSDLATEALNRNLSPARFALQLAAEARQRAATGANITNQERTREQARINAINQEKYRQEQIRNAEKNRQQRDTQFGQTQDQRGFQNMIAIERMLQDQADEEARQGRGLYHDAAAAAAAGAVPYGDIPNLFGDSLSPQMQQVVQGYAKQYGRGAADQNERLQSTADLYNQQLQDSIQQDAPAWYNLFGSSTPPNQLAAPIIQQMLKNKQAQGIRYDPRSNTFIPRFMDTGGYGDNPDDGSSDVPLNDELGFDVGSAYGNAAQAFQQAPQVAPRAQFREGSTIRNRRTGQIFKVQNGQLIPAR